jgi:hypothetical protein
MSLASEITTWQEPAVVPEADGTPSVRFRTRVRTNAGEGRFKGRLATLGLLDRAESIERYSTNWHWTGTGQGYEILWREGTGFDDLLALARL